MKSFINPLARKLNRARTIPAGTRASRAWSSWIRLSTSTSRPSATPRSNPATYTGVFDPHKGPVRFHPDAKAKGYSKGRFSFNVKGGRWKRAAETALSRLRCIPAGCICALRGGAAANGITVRPWTEVQGKEHLRCADMTVEEALKFFENVPSVTRKIQTPV